ncbi:hypothetical protein VKT23_004082 [Stygiomarasmius scandens]|uniref:MARVEL domain-containing protein n=1 Tax=Marasmiellus scandens TaxID=2682957 RepID=A0ABR1JTP1_9AGAR
MQNTFLYVRYVVFAIFIICSAIIASVAVWNMSLAQQDSPISSQVVQVDAYLIFLGAAGLLFSFTVIFVELSLKNTITRRLWFECSWTGLFSVMELAGAASFSSIAPSGMCSTDDDHEECTSTRALMAFTWLCTIFLLSYCFILVASCIIYSIKDPKIWHTSIRDFSFFDNSKLNSPLPTPMPRDVQKARATTPSIKAPQPRRPPPAAENFYNHRSGLGSEYEIEHFQPQIQYANSAPVPTASGSSSRLLNTGYLSLYPQVLQPAETSRRNTRLTSFSSQRRIPEDSEPIIDWPRPDVLSRPVSKRKSRVHSQGSSRDPRASNSIDEARGSQRSRPTGPRARGSTDSRRPPPLDLSNISSYRDRNKDNP